MKKICTVAGCKREQKTKSFCSMHYLRYFRYGTTDRPKNRRGKLIDQGKSYCPCCDKEKLLSEFNKDIHTAYKISIYCKECSKEKGRKRYEQNPEKYKDATLRADFGISLKTYEKMLENQAGVCAICGGADKNKALSVDHNHNTGNVRGLLCSNCNFALGKFKDSRDLLFSALSYLEKYSRGLAGKEEQVMGEVIDMFNMSNKARHLLAIEMAYRKHNLADDEIGWQELGDILCDELCNAYGGDVFAEWVMQFDGGEKSLAKFAKKVK